MNNINPALASAVQSAYIQSNGLADPRANEPKVSDKTTAEASSGGNTTVTLEERSQVQPVDYSDLAATQTVRDSSSVETASTEANQTANGVTYATNLQAQSNYYANQETV